MEQTVQMKIGKRIVQIPIQGAASVETILPNEMKEITDLREELIRSMTTETIGTPSIDDVIDAGDQVTIIVSDITRAWMRQGAILTVLVEYLREQIGVPYENMVILIALGTHRKSTVEEMKTIVTPELYERVQVVDHDCDAADQIYVGTTTRGTRVVVNPLVVGRKVIIVGGTVHHMMAGFGGGRKNILPGVSSRESIRENHRRALDPVIEKTDDRVGCCKLVENPINEDMNEAAEMVSPAFSINIVVNAAGKHSRFFCGHWYEAWQASCQYQIDSYEKPIEKQADIVVVSCGGYPKDINLYQGVKGLINGARAMKKGGTMLFLCDCTEGGGAPDYFSWVKPLREGCLDPALRANFTIGGYIFYLTCETLRKGSYYMLSQIDPEEVRPMGLEADSDLDRLLAKIDFTGKDVYVLPYGGSVVPMHPDEK